MENLDVNAVFWKIFIFRHSSSCSSSWKRLFRKFTFQESVHTIIETVVSSDWETDYGSDGNYLYSSDRLAAAKSGTGQPCILTRQVQFATAKKTMFFSDSVLCLGGIRPDPVRAWKDKINWFMESRQFRELDPIDEKPMEIEWNISPDSLHQGSSPRFKGDD